MKEAPVELMWILVEDKLRDAALLMFANKQDCLNAMNMAEITDKLGLHFLHQRNWHIQVSCITSGDGLYEGLDWLSNQLGNQSELQSSLPSHSLLHPRFSSPVAACPFGVSARSCLQGPSQGASPCCTCADAAFNWVFI